MQELQEIVDSLEAGREPLDVSLEKFERGMALLKNCHRQLDAAAARIEILTGVDDEGNVTTAPFDGSATTAPAADSDEDDETSTLF